MVTEKKYRILLVDDDEDDQIIVRRIVQNITDRPFEITWCSSYEEALPVIDDDSHDIYMIDYRLGAHTGLELLDYARPQRRRQPFILLTGASDKDIERHSLEHGAADYLVKGLFNSELLARTLRYALSRKVSEQQRIEELVELNQTKDDFISLASHQLRTPATGVKQYVGMVLEGFVGDITATQRTILEKAYESNERQLTIVSDLLKIAQVDAGKVILKQSEVDIDAMLRDVIKEQMKTFVARNQSIDYRPSPAAAMAYVDANRFRMVIENILDNASKYSEKNTTIHLTVQREDDRICIQIQDEGVGIAHEDIEKLFGKFSRIHNRLSIDVNGTGLGLYWVKKIIDLHNGYIEVTSQLDEGTTFLIDVPAYTQ